MRHPSSESRFWNPLAALRHARAPWILAIGLSILAAIQALHRARQGRSALLRWTPDLDAFWSGAELYGVGAEGYPTLPITLLVMSPFRALGEVPGAFAWALFKLGLAWWIVTRALVLAGSDGRKLAPMGAVGVIVLSFRPLLSDITHGNLNLLVGAVVVSSAWAWYRGRDVQAGLWMGLGAIMKVTPALGLAFFLYKRSTRGVVGMLSGCAVALFLPALAVGWQRNLMLIVDWWHQMITPYLAGRELSLLQTEHINQSLMGVLARWLTDSVAIPGRGGDATGDITVHVVALGREAFRWVHLVACGATLAFVAWCWAPRGDRRRGRLVLAEFALLALAMLFLSERSWKHHYVLLALPVGYLVWQLQLPHDERRYRLAIFGLAATAVAIGGTGSGFLGAHGSNLAEAYGSFFLGGLALFVATGLALRKEWIDEGDSNADGYEDRSPSRMARRASSAAE